MLICCSHIYLSYVLLHHASDLVWHFGFVVYHTMVPSNNHLIHISNTLEFVFSYWQLHTLCDKNKSLLKGTELTIILGEGPIKMIRKKQPIISGPKKISSEKVHLNLMPEHHFQTLGSLNSSFLSDMQSKGKPQGVRESPREKEKLLTLS